MQLILINFDFGKTDYLVTVESTALTPCCHTWVPTRGMVRAHMCSKTKMACTQINVCSQIPWEWVHSDDRDCITHLVLLETLVHGRSRGLANVRIQCHLSRNGAQIKISPNILIFSDELLLSHVLCHDECETLLSNSGILTCKEIPARGTFRGSMHLSGSKLCGTLQRFTKIMVGLIDSSSALGTCVDQC